MPNLVRPFAIATVTLVSGILILRPSSIEEWVVSFVSLGLLAVLPSYLHPDLPRPVCGLGLGFALGLLLAAVFGYALWLLPMSIAGWCIGLSSIAAKPNQQSGQTTQRKNPVAISLAFTFAAVALVATLLTIWVQQNRALAPFVDNGIEYSQTTLGRPTNCEIIVKIESGTYTIGEDVSADYLEAAASLDDRIQSLLKAGASPSEISIICESSNRRDQNRIWLLREAFDNVDGQALHVLNRPQTTPGQ